MADNRQLHLIFFLMTQAKTKKEKTLMSFADISRLSRTNKSLNTLFKQSVEEEISRLLKSVCLRDSEAIISILTKNPYYVFRKGSVIDHAGRDFKEISPIQLARWGYDIDIYNLLKRYIPQKDAKMRAEMRAEIRKQLLELKEKGTKHGRSAYGVYKELNTAYKTYIKIFDQADRRELLKQSEEIYKLITQIPMDLAYSYCHPSQDLLCATKPHAVHRHYYGGRLIPWIIGGKVNPRISELGVRRWQGRYGAMGEESTALFSLESAKENYKKNKEHFNARKQAFDKIMLNLTDANSKSQSHPSKSEPTLPTENTMEPFCLIF